MKTTVIGAYPKIGDGPEAQELRRALHRGDRGEISDPELGKVFDDVTRTAIGEIEAAGVDVTNDGQIRWDDLLSPFARAWAGVTPGPLERFYDNNTYFRQPVIDGRIVTDGRSLVRDYTFAPGVAKTKLKAAVPGPLTFAPLPGRRDRHRHAQPRYDNLRPARRIPHAVRPPRRRGRAQHAARDGRRGRAVCRARPQARAAGAARSCDDHVARIFAARRRSRQAH